VPVVAIDGPTGSGKGTVSRGLARRLGWNLLDSGALYRLVALAAELQAHPEPRELDVVAASGEQVTAGLVAMALIECGAPARSYAGWQVAVLTGAAKDALSSKLCACFDEDVAPDPDFLNNPAALTGVFAERARSVGAATLALKGIDRGDPVARHSHVRDNLRFYGAPVEMIFHLPGDAVPGSFLAMGCFLQNVMLGLVACGLGSCPQYSVAGYADVIRVYLGLGEEQIVVCGLAVGYVDPAAVINSLVPERAPIDDYVRWLD